MRRAMFLTLTTTFLLACGGDEEPAEVDRIGADPAAVVAVREAWPRLYDRDAEEQREAFLRLLEDLGPRAARAVVAVLSDQAANPRAMQHIYPPDYSETAYPAGTWLARHPSEDLDDVLLEIAADQGGDSGARKEIIVALCREGNSQALDPLAAIALDPEQDEEVRRWIVALLPRLGVPLRGHLTDLLYLPFHDLEYVTAAALALSGEPIAPSLLVEGLRRPAWADVPVATLAQAVLLTAAGDASIAERAEEVMDLHRIGRTIESPGPDDHRDAIEKHNQDLKGSRAALADAFERWLERRPDLRESEFERERREYLESAGRARESALYSTEAVEASAEEEIDLAAAILAVLEIGPEEETVMLAKLDRLTHLLAREIGSDASEERVMNLLHERLLRNYRSLPAGREAEGPPSFLDEVIVCHAGNCLGLTTLYLALAERLELPLHGVGVPRHIFLRWDDGKTRTNYELTAGGVQVADAEYRSLDPARMVDEESESRGVFLRNLSKREVVSYVLVNRSSAYADNPRFRPPEKFTLARSVVERALGLYPENGTAYLCRASVRFRADPLDAAQALEDVRRALELHPVSVEGRGIAAAIHYAVGDYEAALHLIESTLVIAPEDQGALANRAWCLLKLSRMERGRAEVEGGLARWPGSGRFRRLRLSLRILDGDAGWREDLGELEPRPDLDPRMHLAVAEELLKPASEHLPDPESAEVVLSQISYLAEDSSNERNIRGFMEGLTLESAPWTIEAQKRLYLELRARTCELLEQDAEAREYRRRLEALGD